jgi:hypothetical protein
MTPPERELTLTAEVWGHTPSALSATALDLEPRARARRAAAIALPLLAVAIASLPIPGWHFIGTPGGLIGAVVLGARRWRERRLLGPARGPCPACGEAVEYPLAPAAELPARLACPRCGEFTTLRLQPAA